MGPVAGLCAGLGTRLPGCWERLGLRGSIRPATEVLADLGKVLPRFRLSVDMAAAGLLPRLGLELYHAGSWGNEPPRAEEGEESFTYLLETCRSLFPRTLIGAEGWKRLAATAASLTPAAADREFGFEIHLAEGECGADLCVAVMPGFPLARHYMEKRRRGRRRKPGACWGTLSGHRRRTRQATWRTPCWSTTSRRWWGRKADPSPGGLSGCQAWEPQGGGRATTNTGIRGPAGTSCWGKARRIWKGINLVKVVLQPGCPETAKAYMGIQIDRGGGRTKGTNDESDPRPGLRLHDRRRPRTEAPRLPALHSHETVWPIGRHSRVDLVVRA